MKENRKSMTDFDLDRKEEHDGCDPYIRRTLTLTDRRKNGGEDLPGNLAAARHRRRTGRPPSREQIADARADRWCTGRSRRAAMV
jgi:hypothetical protein